MDWLYVGRERIEAELQVIRSVATSKMGAKQGPIICRSRIASAGSVPEGRSSKLSCLELPEVNSYASILNACDVNDFSSFFDLIFIFWSDLWRH